MTLPFQYAARGGTLTPDDPSYIVRQADTDLYEALQQNDYCYVLNSRQVGKSSLIVRVARRLRQENVKVAVLELTKFGSSGATAEKWYRSVLDVIGKPLGKHAELVAFWNENKELEPLYRWMQALRHVVLSSSENYVICFDEIDSVQTLPFSTDSFFAAIRACFNERTEEPALQRLTFCLVGVVTPSELIQDARITPFNIGRRIDLTDFTEEEANILIPGLQRDEKQARVLLQRILYWTNGHPYLTQKLCQAVAEDAATSTAAGVDRLCEDLFFSSRSRDQENNLQHVRTMLLTQKTEEDQAAILDLYRQVRRQKKIKDDDTNPIISVLRLAGLVKVWENYLWVRNHIYFRVFDEAWIIANLPDAEKRRQEAARRHGFLQAFGISSVVVAIMAGLAIWAWLAQQEAAKSEQKAEQQLNIALQQKAIALAAIDTLTYDLADELVKLPRTQELVTKILQNNMALLDKIYALDPDTQQALREKSVNLSKTGDIWLNLGKTNEALTVYQQSHDILKQLVATDPNNTKAQRDLSVSYNMLGNVQLRLGNTTDALQAYQQYFEISQRLAAADPNNTQAQRNLSISYNKLGNVQLRLGNTTDALQAYQQSLEIDKRFVAADPNNTEAQRDLSVSYSKLGDVQLRLGNTTDALQAYQQSLEIRKRLAAADPNNTQAQRDLSISYNKLGDVQLRLGNTTDALQAYQQTHEILKRLAADPNNTEAQRDLSVSYNKLGDVQLRLGNTTDALQAYQQTHEILKRLAAADPNNTEAQRDLSVSYNKLGDVQLRLGNTTDALQAYQQSLDIRQRLAAADPNNTEAQRDLSVSYNNLGDVQLRLGNTTDALQAYQQMHEILKRLAAADPNNTQAQRDLSVSYSNIAEIHLKNNKLDEALAWYQKSLTIDEKLVAQDPQNQTLQDDLKYYQRKIADIEKRLKSK